MYARRLDIRECSHRVLELTFKGSLVIHLLVEFRSNPVRFVEYLKPKPAILDSALCGGCEPGFIELRHRHANSSTVRSCFERNLCLSQHLSNLARIVGIEIHKECPPIGAESIP